MSMTPVEMRHVSFGRRLFGYHRDAVDRTIEEAARSFENVWRERCDLSDKVEALESEIGRYRDLEGLLRTTLVSAERNAAELRAEAERQAKAIIDDAHNEARSVTHRARSERERLLVEAHRVRTLLSGALAHVDEAPALEPVDAGAEPDEDDGTAHRRAA
jgi:cell division initiation protein